MDKAQYVCYCGLYCELCGWRGAIPKAAAALREEMRKGDFEDFGPSLKGFNEFWEFLGGLADVPDDKCCRTGKCGAPFCAIRKCAQSRGVEHCPMCTDYPCERIETLAASEATLIHDGRRMKEVRVEAWIAEQEQRRAAGFDYAHVRTGKCVVPEG
jgi:hypothetical protein